MDLLPLTRLFERYGVPSADLAWTGRPTVGLKFYRRDVFLVPFSLMWGGFAIFWESTVLRTDAPFFMKLWGIPFVLVGLYFIAGRFFWDAYRRSTTYYGVTHEAALVLRQGMGGGLQRLYLPAIQNVGLELNQDGSGTISFGDAPAGSFWGKGGQNWSGPDVPSFEGIANAQSVYDLCIKAQHPNVNSPDGPQIASR